LINYFISTVRNYQIPRNPKLISKLRDYLEKELLKIENTSLNGSKDKRLYNVTNIRFEGKDADAIMINFNNVIVSNDRYHLLLPKINFNFQ